MPTVQQLQAELAAAKTEINRLQQQNASLLEQLAELSITTAPTLVSTATISRPSAFPLSLQLKPYTKRHPSPELEFPLHQKASKSKYAPLLPSQTAAVRTFSPPSTNQEFKYLHLSIQCYILIRQIRSLL
ncbi:hypothetical protein RO3G_12394 [Rhizopus delemar RA 99-880]|uniref:Uncharacterized protein n=1 Tax=Rhizopus delemar (strain RA 99-880 / ATCC MYA-4621 / FGSC 9543 / NRRL 43880) TaxID=246409 RepID=I1CGV3_RHIO9|nr:hypothetical protein RO3G_12394 [Rhizopus delemar RA 99-880]KAG1164784.1 hypothetical protein G6F36_013734 [Rhizopus arrhizus]|eukprot:EIE87683.1 hypothetical protein RO3G_12394 [Rhizopus delemar RA 99-880]